MTRHVTLYLVKPWQFIIIFYMWLKLQEKKEESSLYFNIENGQTGKRSQIWSFF